MRKLSSLVSKHVRSDLRSECACSLDAVLEMQYVEALQNFRGYLGTLREQRQKSRYKREFLDPTNAHYQILGVHSGQNDTERPLEVKGEAGARLTYLSTQVLIRLAAYVHSKLQNAGLGSSEQESTTVSTPTTSTSTSTSTSTTSSHARVRHLVVGFSGGADSTLALVLAAQMQQRYGYEVLAVHCIHGLDPDDDIWLEHNQKLCRMLQVTLKTPKLNIVYGAGRSPEEVSRAARYAALLQELRSDSCLVLGHQADDQVENLLLALKRGAGPHGLSGMRLLTRDERGLLLRPLLLLHKSEIEQILYQLQVDFVYDLSNSYLKFERNFMRLKILPQLRERFVGIDKAILRTQLLCSYEHEIAERWIEEKLPEFLEPPLYGSEGYSFNFERLDLSDRPQVFMLLRAWIKHSLGFSAELNALERCYELMLKEHDKNGEVHLTPSPYVASTFRHYLCLYRPLPEQSRPAQLALSALLATAAAIPPCADAGAAAAIAPDTTTAGTGGDSGEESVVPCQVISWVQVGSMRYYLLQLEQSPLSKGPWGYYNPKGERYYRAVTYTGKCFKLRTLSCFAHAASQRHDLSLVFNYSQSLKLKPRTRAHSREIKKLFVEYDIAPWIRPALPLVCTSSGQILACATLWAQKEDTPSYIGSTASASTTTATAEATDTASSTPASEQVLLALAMERVD